mmetsp:Transcript_8643/g.23742  ORF Transcript_8643/g.23742 Transcript_8643/m.23742 type:complete len:202 (-) Transcript_8643:419-1024(-)
MKPLSSRPRSELGEEPVIGAGAAAAPANKVQSAFERRVLVRVALEQVGHHDSHGPRLAARTVHEHPTASGPLLRGLSHKGERLCQDWVKVLRRLVRDGDPQVPRRLRQRYWPLDDTDHVRDAQEAECPSGGRGPRPEVEAAGQHLVGQEGQVAVGEAWAEEEGERELQCASVHEEHVRVAAVVAQPRGHRARQSSLLVSPG